jgi:CheY-like chemotaxis protein
MTKIMLVEDDKSLREIYGVRLLAEGYEITSAGDGEEALAMAVKEHPDLILSDVMMPKISGFDMLDILRATPETKDIKVIMMTALSSEDQRARGESLGADRYLVKSQVGIEDVVKSVREVINSEPVATIPTSQPFGTPAPSTATTPQPFTIPIQLPQTAVEPALPPPFQVPISSPAPVAPEPIQPMSITIPAPEPIFEPALPPPFQLPISAPAPIPSPIPITQPASELFDTVRLPQPTAPFSTAAPASLGDNTFNSPIQPPTPATDVTSDMGQEPNYNPPEPQYPEQPYPPQV